MKRLFMIAMMCLPFFCIAQNVPKKANAIIITTSLNEDAALKKIGRLLINDGFEMQTLDKDFYMLATKPKKVAYGMLNAGKIIVKITAQIDKKNDSTVVLIKGKVLFSDYFKPEEFDAKSVYICNKGAKSSPARAAWETMNNLVLKFEGENLKYLVQ